MKKKLEKTRSLCHNNSLSECAFSIETHNKIYFSAIQTES